MSKFEELCKAKISQLNEAVPTATGSVGNASQIQAGAQTVAQPATQPVAQTATQPQQQNPQSGPEQHLVNAFKSIAWAQPQQAVQSFNLAFKNAGNIPGMTQFFQNVGYDPAQGFVYSPQVAGQVAPGSTPGATATNTATR